jgi:hypothetical protein
MRNRPHIVWGGGDKQQGFARLLAGPALAGVAHAW